MMKKILAVAIVSAFAAPAFAATANVDISGVMAWDVTKVGNTGNVNQNTYRLNSNNSRFTFRGSEDLGGGMKAGFSLTYGLGSATTTTTTSTCTDNTDVSTCTYTSTTANGAGAPGSGSGVAAQEQYVFLSTGFGELRAGVHDPLIKSIGRAVDLFGNQSTGDGRHLTATAGHNIDGRADNVVAYISPNFSGFQIAVGKVLDETKVANSQESDMATATYRNGGLYLGLGYHKADRTNDLKAWRLGASYTMGDLRVVAMYDSVDNVNNNAAADHKVWGLGAGYKMGAITLKGQYYTRNDDRANWDSKMYALGADYAFSKRTVAQLAYSKVKNDTSATYGGGAPVAHMDNLTIGAGFDPSRFSLGLSHSF